MRLCIDAATTPAHIPWTFAVSACSGVHCSCYSRSCRHTISGMPSALDLAKRELVKILKELAAKYRVSLSLTCDSSDQDRAQKDWPGFLQGPQGS